MSARFYNTQELDLERLAQDLENILRAQGYQAQHFGGAEQKVVQLRKGGDLEKFLGLQAALSVIVQRTAGGVTVTTGHQQWVDKAVVGVAGVAIPPLWPLLFTAGVGALRQATLDSEVMTIVDGLIRQQQPQAQSWPAQPGYGQPGWPPQPQPWWHQQPPQPPRQQPETPPADDQPPTAG
jgi:hypothetical protein